MEKRPCEMTSGYEKRKAVDEGVRYEAGRQRGLNGEVILDKKGHTKPFLDGIVAGSKELARIARGETGRIRKQRATKSPQGRKRQSPQGTRERTGGHGP